MPPSPNPNLLLVLPNRDISQVPSLQGMFNKYFAVVRPCAIRISMLSELAMHAKQAGTSFVATTDISILRLADPSLQGSQNDNIGTIAVVKNPISPTAELRIILLPTLAQQHTVNYGAFLIDHFLQKLRYGGTLKKDRFTWNYIGPHNLNSIAGRISGSSFLVAVDIETSRTDLRITSVAYTAGFYDSTTHAITTETYVIRLAPDTYPFCVDAMRVMNSTKPPKVMQNGQYDASYFLRFNAALENWLYDTFTMAHCIYAELPRDLAFLSSFYLENFRFWKDESGTNLYEYNAKDTHNTFWLWLAQIQYAPEYAIHNYKTKFPSVFPCLSCAMDGMQVNLDTMQRLHTEESNKRDAAQRKLAYLLGEPNFNPGSSKQTLEMFAALGYKPSIRTKTIKGKQEKVSSSDEKEMNRFKETSILYERIGDYILDYRGAAKAVSTYFEVTLYHDPAGIYPPRLMYKLEPTGTDTGRLASQESPFWCGTQVQNIPGYARAMVESEPGWSFGAVDKSQAESYCTGYLSQELGLIKAVTTSPDFHCHNASMFFGIPFAELYDAIKRKVLRKDIRTLSKRVNHGANYNMGARVLLTTMGSKAVAFAKGVLKLPSNWSLLKVCEHLMECFDKAYPRIRKDWYNQTIMEVIKTGKLVNPTGYTRRTFLRPHKSKPELNSAVAHAPQSLSSELVERAMLDIWRTVQLGSHKGRFRLKAPIHDEILFIAKDEVLEECLEIVATKMVIPIVIHGRTMTIPSTKASGKLWSECKD